MLVPVMLWAQVCLWDGLAGCREARPAADRVPDAEVAAAAGLADGVVSRVEGRPITLREVRRAAVDAEISSREALRRLQARNLLFEEALRRGTRLGTAGRIAVRKALVQALLIRDVEGVAIDSATLRTAYEAQHERFNPPERRASVHILAVVDPTADSRRRMAARRLAARALGFLREQAFAAAAEQAQQLGRSEGFEVKAEAVPAVAAQGGLSQPYLEALFAQPGPGVVPSPVQTRYGFHAIKVTDVIQPQATSFSQARAALLQELQLEQRRESMSRLVGQLLTRVPVVRHGGVITALAEIRP